MLGALFFQMPLMPVLLRAFAPLREMGFLIQATVLAKAQRRKSRKGKTTALAPLHDTRRNTKFPQNCCRK
jgi:hypothetical protein